MSLKKHNVAVALGSQDYSTPSVLAIGEREVAGRMRSLALRYGIPTVKRDELATELTKFVEEQEIPPELYNDVAALLQSVNNADGINNASGKPRFRK